MGLCEKFGGCSPLSLSFLLSTPLDFYSDSDFYSLNFGGWVCLKAGSWESSESSDPRRFQAFRPTIERGGLL